MPVENRYKLALNIKDKVNKYVPTVTAFDKTIFEFEVWDGGKLFELSDTYMYHLVTKSPGKNSVIREGSLTVSGLVEAEFSYSETQYLRPVDCALQIYDEDMNRITSMRFRVEIMDDLSREGGLPAESPRVIIADEELLTQAITDSSAAKTEVEQARGEEESLSARFDSVAAELERKASVNDISNLTVELSGKAEVTELYDIASQKADASELDAVAAQLADTASVIVNTESKFDQFNYSPSNGWVTFLDDDGHSDVFNILKPMFDAKGKKFTSAIITSYPGSNANYMTWEQIKQLHSEGHNIESHTHTHPRLASLSSSQQIFEMQKSKELLVVNGIMPNHLVYPQGDYNDVTMENIFRFYKSGVATKLSAYQNGLLPPLLEGKISRIGLGSWQDLTTQEIKNRLDTAMSQGRWIIFMTHIWANNSEVPSEGNIAAIQSVLNYCVEKNYNIGTYDQVFRRYCNREMIGNNNITNKPYRIIGADYKEYTNIKDLQSKVQSTNLTFSALPSEYLLTNDATVTIKEMSGAESNTNDAPVKLAGMLITESPTPLSSRVGYVKQTFKVFESNDLYTRSGLANGTWSAWSQVNFSRYSNTTLYGTETPSTFKAGVTYREIPGSIASALPGARAGLLITERVGTSLGYVKQTYKHHALNNTYVRSGKDDDTWTTWTLVTSTEI